MKRKTIENWLNTDKNLQELIAEIEATVESSVDKAEMAFEKLSSQYKIPRMPNDINEEDKDFDIRADSRSLFEEHALIKYLSDSDEDPRGLVLSAAFNLSKGYRVDYMAVAEKEFGKTLPAKCRIAIKGDGFNGQVVFPQKETKSWIDLGCKIMKQIN